MPKRKSRGNLQRQLKSLNFDLASEMVKLYPDLTPVGKLNALQTLIKYLHPEPRAALVKVSRRQADEVGNSREISASLPSSPLLLQQLAALAKPNESTQAALSVPPRTQRAPEEATNETWPGEGSDDDGVV